MKSDAKTVKQYLVTLPDDRRQAIEAIRRVILKNLPKGYEEGMQYGMIGYYVPHSLYPPGYHCDPQQPLPFVSLASQKNHMAIYLMLDEEFEQWFREAWTSAGKKLDRGKSCVRFRKIEDVPLKVVGQAVKRIPVKKLIATYESAIQQGSRRRSSKAPKKGTAAKAAPKKKAAKKTAKKRVAKKVSAKKKAARR